MPNVHILKEGTVQIEDVLFCGTTLWHDITPHMENHWMYTMMDCKRIRATNYRRLLAHNLVGEHVKAVNFIDECRKLQGYRKKVLVTHHGISDKSIAERYKGDVSNIYYSCDRPELLLGFDWYFHGHMHSAASYTLNECKVRLSPKGYPGEVMNYQFLSENI